MAIRGSSAEAGMHLSSWKCLGFGGWCGGKTRVDPNSQVLCQLFSKYILQSAAAASEKGHLIFASDICAGNFALVLATLVPINNWP
jgi:hypothetical protein